jgi:hypothetical protein
MLRSVAREDVLHPVGYWREAIVGGGSLVGLTGGLLYLVAAAADPLAIEEVRTEDDVETALIGILFVAPYLLALYGAVVAKRRRSYGLTAVAAATVFSLIHIFLAAFSVIGLLFAMAAVLLVCGSASLFVARPLSDAGSSR